MDRSKGKNRRPRKKFESNCFNCEKKGHPAGECRRVKKSEKLEILPPTRRAEVRASATSVGVRSTLRTGTAACTRVLSIGLANVRSEELRRVRCGAGNGGNDGSSLWR